MGGMKQLLLAGTAFLALNVLHSAEAAPVFNFAFTGSLVDFGLDPIVVSPGAIWERGVRTGATQAVWGGREPAHRRLPGLGESLRPKSEDAVDIGGRVPV